jgi:hypothetical protein
MSARLHVFVLEVTVGISADDIQRLRVLFGIAGRRPGVLKLVCVVNQDDQLLGNV